MKLNGTNLNLTERLVFHSKIRLKCWWIVKELKSWLTPCGLRSVKPLDLLLLGIVFCSGLASSYDNLIFLSSINLFGPYASFGCVVYILQAFPTFLITYFLWIQPGVDKGYCPSCPVNHLNIANFLYRTRKHGRGVGWAFTM